MGPIERTVDLRLPAEGDYASLVALVVDDAAARAEIGGEQRVRFVEAARYAFDLIVRDAMIEQREPLHLRTECTPAELRVRLTERGLPLDDAAVHRDPRWHDISSRVDRAHWLMRGRSGSELELAITRPHGVARAVEPPPAASVPLAPDQTYAIRRFEPQDAPGVARAFYLTWGYNYIFPAVYVPQRLVELNASNAYISVVAAGENGEIVGHYALDPRPGAPIADGCAAIVVPAHRGRGLLEKLRAFAEREAVRLGFAAYYSEPVTTHGRTQSESAKFGAHLCAIVLGGDPKSFVPKAMDYTGAGQRQSFTVYFKPLSNREPRTIYPPPEHRGMIEQIYANLGLPVESGEDEAPSGEGELRVEHVHSEGYATIDVLTPGASTCEHVAQAVSDMRALGHLGALYVNLPLEHAATPQLCRALERLGFYFCGVIPWWLAGGDALRLQLPLTPIDLSQVTIVGEFGEQLKAYIERSAQTAADTAARR